MLRSALEQFAVLRGPRSSAYRSLLLARLISALGTWTAFYAVRIALYDATDSIAWVSILLFCELAPGVVLGLTVGPIVDRWPRQHLMIACELGGLAVFAALPFVQSPAGICALSAVAGFSAAFFRPGCYSAIPNLVDDAQVVAANAFMQGAENVASLLGPVLAGLGIALIGAHPLYALNAISFGVSALLLLRVGNRLQASRAGALATRHWRQVKEGLLLVRRNAHLSAVFMIWSWATLAYAGINVAEISLARDAYGTSDLGFGILVAVAAAGIVTGNLLAGWSIERIGVYGAYRLSFLVTGLGVLVCAAAPGLVVGCVGSVVYGLGNGVGLVCNITLIQRVVPDAGRGQIFAVLGSLVMTFTLIGTLAAGPVSEALGPRLTWTLAAGILAVGWINSLVVTRRRGIGDPEADPGAHAPEDAVPVATAPVGAVPVGATGSSGVDRLESILGQMYPSGRPRERLRGVPRVRRLLEDVDAAHRAERGRAEEAGRPPETPAAGETS